MYKLNLNFASRAFGCFLAPAMCAAILITATTPFGTVQAGVKNTVIAVIPIPGYNPNESAVTRDGNTAYVAAEEGSGGPSELFVINAISTTVVTSIPLTGQNEAFGVAITPDGTQVFVSNVTSNTISVISTASNTVTSTITAGTFPEGLAVTPDGSELWVANNGDPGLDDGTVTVYSVSNGSLINTIDTGGTPTQIQFSRSGKTAYVLNDNGGVGFVDVIDTKTGNITNPNLGFGMIFQPFIGMSLSPSGQTLFAGNGVATITALDINDSATASGLNYLIPVFSPSEPQNSQALGQTAITPDGKYLYVADFSVDQVSFIAANPKKSLGTVDMPAGSGPYNLTLSPNGTYLYVSNFNGETVAIVAVKESVFP